LIMPNTGSTSMPRILYKAMPRLVRSRRSIRWRSVKLLRKCLVS
jgi:hypothetical protein